MASGKRAARAETGLHFNIFSEGFKVAKALVQIAKARHIGDASLRNKTAP
jgi:hypothetical protein